jgi:hypothetical protein
MKVGQLEISLRQSELSEDVIISVGDRRFHIKAVVRKPELSLVVLEAEIQEKEGLTLPCETPTASTAP